MNCIPKVLCPTFGVQFSIFHGNIHSKDGKISTEHLVNRLSQPIGWKPKGISKCLPNAMRNILTKHARNREYIFLPLDGETAADTPPYYRNSKMENCNISSLNLMTICRGQNVQSMNYARAGQRSLLQQEAY